MDKNKIIEGAAKLVAKGAYDKAIKEYQKVLEADPKDVRVLQKMGELFQKKNDNVQAAQYFTQVAESYSSDGFFLKAVALYKQVLKLNPGLMSVNMKLAELHQQLGLMSEAMAYFQMVANAYDKEGNTKASLDTLKKMVDLDPDNVASRTKLAELYAREGMNKEALTEFKRAADYLKKNNRGDDYLRVAERISTIEPENLELAKELASKYLSGGDQKRALAKLQTCFKNNPKDVETLNLLAQAFQGLGQTSKTISVYKELAKIYSDGQRTDEEQKVWAKVKELDPHDPDLPASAGGGGASAPARASTPAPAPAPARPPPAPVQAPSSAPVVAAAPAGGKDQLGKLLTETDVYLKYGLHDKALEHIKKVFSIDPDNLDGHEKAYNIYLNASDAAKAMEECLIILRLCTRRNEVQRAQPYLVALLEENPKHPEVPTFMRAFKGISAPASPETEPAEDAILVESADEEILVADAPEDELAKAASEDLALAAATNVEVEEIVGQDEELEPVEITDTEIDEPMTVVDPIETDEPLTDPSGINPAMLRAAAEPDPDLEDAPTRVHTIPKAVLDSTLVTQARIPAPKPPKEVAKTAAAAAAPPKPAPVKAPAKAAPPAAKAAPPPVKLKPPPEEPAAEEVDEASFFIEQGLHDDAKEILDTVLLAYPEHRRAKELLDRIALATGEKPATDAFDLAAELADELGDLGGEEAGAPAPAEDDFQYSVEEVFSEFKKGLEKVVKPEDVDTHYDLGIAYKEMGLIDDGIGEFTVARQGCIGKKKEVDCLTMLGLLQSMKGDHQAAVESFKTALSSEHAAGEATKALEFELGTAWEAIGSPGKALYYFSRVAKADPKYRQVTEIVARLSAVAQPEEDAPAKPSRAPNGVHGKPGPVKSAEPGGAQKARKVGYV